MEPILTLIAANVKFRLIVRLTTQTEQLLSITCMFAFAANKFREIFGLFFGNIHAIAVEPIVTQITTNVKSVKMENYS